MTEAPLNIQEFNKVAGLVFAQLYKAFPLLEDIDRKGIAKTMGVVGDDFTKHTLPSGRSFHEVLRWTILWLRDEGYTRAAGTLPTEHVILTTKGLAAMNAVPSGVKESLGNELRKAVDSTTNPDLSKIGDLVGGIFGGFTKSMAGG